MPGESRRPRLNPPGTGTAYSVMREEFEARAGVLEREVEGEKMVTRHILEQSRRNSDDLVGIKMRLDRMEMCLDGMEVRLDGMEKKLDSLGGMVSGLTRNLPAIVTDAMRGVLWEHDQQD